MQYVVTYTETLAKAFKVEADSADEARDKLLEAVRAERVVLDADDFSGFETQVDDPGWYVLDSLEELPQAEGAR